MDSKHPHPANLIDLTFIHCPLCNKQMVDGLWHACKNLLQSDEYVNKVKHIRISWHSSLGWRCYGGFEGDHVQLSFSDVFNLVTSDENWESVGTWKNPKLIKNIY